MPCRETRRNCRLVSSDTPECVETITVGEPIRHRMRLDELRHDGLRGARQVSRGDGAQCLDSGWIVPALTCARLWSGRGGQGRSLRLPGKASGRLCGGLGVTSERWPHLGCGRRTVDAGRGLPDSWNLAGGSSGVTRSRFHRDRRRPGPELRRQKFVQKGRSYPLFAGRARIARLTAKVID